MLEDVFNFYPFTTNCAFMKINCFIPAILLQDYSLNFIGKSLDNRSHLKVGFRGVACIHNGSLASKYH